MIDTVYIEKEIINNKTTKSIISKLGKVDIVLCDRYTEVFNRKSQNFRLQKKNPSLILAYKKKKLHSTDAL